MVNSFFKIIEKMTYGEISNDIDESNYINFKKEEAKAWGKKSYSKWANEYMENMEETKKIVEKFSTSYAAIEMYCGYAHRDINSYLRFKQKETIYLDLVSVLSVIICMAPRIPDNIVVYRAVSEKFIYELIDNNKSLGIPTQEKGFMSTSLTMDMFNKSKFNDSNEFKNTKNILKIYVNSGAKGIYVEDISKRSELEIILPPNCFLKMIKKPYYENDKEIYECKLIYF
ncbi:ADP-ribosyltransferase [Clostridium sp.]|uniref:ADP-ribosyltransferase n=1 Tax=Clostridium sp. TaxID=1506 RepID=UPI0025BB4ED5|nr:ADP-ribosyltransferase [Clostridium sp.]